MHHVRHIRKFDQGAPKGFTRVMAALNRKQVPVCKACHERIHRGEYDGLSLKDLAYDLRKVRLFADGSMVTPLRKSKDRDLTLVMP